ncbi:MAG: CHAT domain-containing protein [Chitinophagaceae bacterium]|nr:MAG: CHAT domain-containing protein [Chitinophagaceae bacterium]
MKTLFGSRKRLPLSRGGNWWNRVNVQLQNKSDLEDGVRCLLFSSSTGGAREEQRELYSTTAIIEHLIEDISKNDRWSTDLARTVFELLIPNDFKEQLQRQGHIIWSLDKFTAAYPWELLQDGSKEGIPFSVNGGMVRQLATQDYRLRINAVTTDNALVIGDPNLHGFINQLPGAKQEAESVAGLLSNNGFSTNAVIYAESHQIIRELMRQDYKIIHMAGHGVFEEVIKDNGKENVRTGMVIGKDIYLSTREIKQMSTVPELVFVNCCFLGQVQSQAEELSRSRYKMAANIGTQLIENGVKAVVVAGWAVDDAAALEFANVFYSCMFKGSSFGDAVLEARQSVYQKHGQTNTWGAYQCYGDPFYKFRESYVAKANTKWQFVTVEEALIELNNLSNQFETENYSDEELTVQLSSIEEAIAKAGLKDARILEQIAFMYAELANYDEAVDRFQQLLTLEEASFSVAALEKYCNIRSKKCVADFNKDKTNKQPLKDIRSVIKDLEKLVDLGSTAERHNLLGSTYKRLAFMLTGKEEKIATLEKAKDHYYVGHQSASHRSAIYGLSNFLEIEGVLNLVNRTKWIGEVFFEKVSYPYNSSDDVLQLLEKLLMAIDVSHDEMNFWELTNEANIRLCMMIVDPKKAEENTNAWDEVLKVYRKVWVKAGSRAKKVAEVEYLEMLADGLSLSGNRSLAKMKADLKKFKNELSKMV